MANEWNGLQWESRPDGIHILKYVGNAASVEIPDCINGQNITKVERYAFSNLRFLQEVGIGRHVTEIDNYAFYDTRNLEQIELWDSVRSIGDGAFRNCEKLKKIRLHSENGRDACIRGVLSECQQEIEAEIDYPETAEPSHAAEERQPDESEDWDLQRISSENKAYLLFPEYGIEYFENAFTRTSMFRTETYGSGEAYRDCLQDAAVDFRAYDLLFGRAGREDRGPAAAAIALLRLRYPRGLTAEARQTYAGWLKENAAEGVRWILETGDDSFLTFMKEQGIFTAANITPCLDAAEAAGEPSAAAALLTVCLAMRQTEAGDRKPSGRRRKYDL